MAIALQRILPTNLPSVERTSACGSAEATAGAVLTYQVRKDYADLATTAGGRDQLTYLLEPFRAA